MRSLEVTLAVDYARRGAIAIPLALLTMIALPLWIYALLGTEGKLDPTSREAVIMHVTLTLCMGFGAAVAVFQAHGKLARFYVRPISVARLVTLQMALGMLTIAAMYICSAAIFNLQGLHWPLLGPALFLATTLACALAAIWTFEGTTIGQLIGCTATSVPLVIWFNRCYGATIMGDWQSMWSAPTGGEALTLAGISAAAYLTAIASVQRTRRGELWEFATLRAWWERQIAGLHAAPQFRSPMAAQAWCQWRQTFGALPICLIVLFMLFMLAFRLFGLVPTTTMLEVMALLPLTTLTLLLPMVFGLMLGNCGGVGTWRGMSHVLATRPVTDTFIALALLRNCAQVLLGAWGTWFVCLSIVAGLLSLSGNRTEVLQALFPTSFNNDLRSVLPIVVLPLLSWTFTTIMATLIATGRPWLSVLVLVSIFCPTVWFVASRETYSPATFAWLVHSWLLLSGSFYLGVTTWAFIAALRQRLIGSRLVVPAALAWLLASAALILYPGQSSHDASWIYHSIGLFALAIFPFAAMPLAVRWNRHR